jgi:chromosome partitioning protein
MMPDQPTTIAFMNQKGGVGKTTTCANLGAALADRGMRVLLVDLDPQCHLSINFGHDPQDDEASLHEVLSNESTLLQAVRRIDGDAAAGLDGEVHLLPGSLALAGLEAELADAPDRQLRLRQALQGVGYGYDVVLLDCPPSLGLLTVNALAAADKVLVPMQAHFLALQGFSQLLQTVRHLAGGMNPKLKVLGVVLTMHDANTRLAADVAAELEGFFTAARGTNLPWGEAELLETRIRRNIKLAEAPSFGQPILTYDPTSHGAADYAALAEEVAALLRLIGEPTATVHRTTTAGLKTLNAREAAVA